MGTCADSEDSVQMPQNVASEQCLHCLFAGISMQNTTNMKTSTRTPKTRNGLIQIIRMKKFTGLKRVSGSNSAKYLLMVGLHFNMYKFIFAGSRGDNVTTV